MKKPKHKLEYPYNYYWKKYAIKSKCPFCDADIEFTSENYDIVKCNAYGGFLSIHADASYALDQGECKKCMPCDPLEDRSWSVEKCEETSPYREVVKEDMFLCEQCHHGVLFSSPPEMVKELFLHPGDEKECKHCRWHEEHVKKEKPNKKDFSDF